MGLPKFVLGDVLTKHYEKLNALVSAANSTADELGTQNEVLEFLAEEIFHKMDRKPFFFNIKAEMVSSTALKDDDSCFVLGDTKVYDGRMKMFYITKDTSSVPDGTEVIQLQYNPTLSAVHIPETTEFDVRQLIQENSDRLSQLERMVLHNEFSAPIATDDAKITLLVDDTGCSILADWKYKEV